MTGMIIEGSENPKLEEEEEIIETEGKKAEIRSLSK
jgi:hypothetical protein